MDDIEILIREVAGKDSSVLCREVTSIGDTMDVLRLRLSSAAKPAAAPKIRNHAFYRTRLPQSLLAHLAADPDYPELYA